MHMLTPAESAAVAISDDMEAETSMRAPGFSDMRFLVADDHPLYREAVRAQIERMFEGATVEEVNSIDELFSRFVDTDPQFDIFLLDLYMPGMSPEAIKKIAGQFPGVAIAVISGTGGISAIRRCIKAGARGFIPKTATGEHLAHALQILLSGGTTVPAQVLLDGHDSGDEEESVFGVSEAAAEYTPESWVNNLTERELEVLRELVRGASNKQIARTLGIAEVTVKFHLRVLFQKIGVTRRAQAAVAATKAGIS